MAAFLFDAAITACGITIDNALAERINTGTKDKPAWNPKYTLHQILEPDFVLPSPESSSKPTNGIGALLAMAQQKGGGVKLWKAV